MQPPQGHITLEEQAASGKGYCKLTPLILKLGTELWVNVQGQILTAHCRTMGFSFPANIPVSRSYCPSRFLKTLRNPSLLLQNTMKGKPIEHVEGKHPNGKNHKEREKDCVRGGEEEHAALKKLTPFC